MANASVNMYILGDEATGKTSLLKTFKENRFPDAITGDDLFIDFTAANIIIDDIDIDLGLYDSPGHVNYFYLNRLHFPPMDVLLICFSVDAPETFEKITNLWVGSMKRSFPKIPFILVGNKKELRNYPTVINDLRKLNLKPVTTTEGCAVAKKIKAYAYLECSAKTGEGVHEVFEAATRVGLQFKKNRRKNKCCLL